MKIAKSLENFVLLIKSVSQAIENETKEQRSQFLGTSGINLLENVLPGKCVIRTGKGDTSSKELKGW